MADNDKLLDAIAKLIELTQDGKLRWSALPSSLIDALKETPYDRIAVAFQANYKDRYLRLYKRNYKVAYNPFSTVAIVQAAYYDKEDSWYSTVVLQLTTSDDLVLWSFPFETALWDLYRAVEYQVSKVKDFLDDLLSEQDKSAKFKKKS